MSGKDERIKALEERLAGVEEISRAVASNLDLDELLPRLMRRITEIMSCERSTLFLFDQEKEELWSKVLHGEESVTVRLPLGKGIAGEVARSGKSLNLDDAYAHPLFLPDIDRLTGYRTRSLLTIPLNDNLGAITGVVQILNRSDGRPFDDADQSLIESLSSQISHALQTARLYSSILRHNRELDVISEIEREVGCIRETEEVLGLVLAKAIDAIGCEAGSILLMREEENGKLYFRTALGVKGMELKGFTMKVGQGIVGWVAGQGRAARVNDVSTDERYDPSLAQIIDFPVRQVLAVPLLSEGKVIGAVELVNRDGDGPFTEENERFLTFIANQIVRALKSVREAREKEQRERLATIGRMLAGVIHDLKTPMTVITGCADFLRTEREDRRREELANRILNQLDVLQKMTEDLMAFARGESRVLVRKVYLHLFLEEMENLVEVEAADTPIEVVWKPDYEGVAFFDADSIRRALLNLVRNGIEAMPDGGTLTISVDENNGQVVFQVADTGQGVPEEIRNNLFEAFVTSGKEDGTGLGLAIVKQAVNDHGGTVEVETETGKGTTFTISLPLTPPAADDPHA